MLGTQEYQSSEGDAGAAPTALERPVISREECLQSRDHRSLPCGGQGLSLASPQLPATPGSRAGSRSEEWAPDAEGGNGRYGGSSQLRSAEGGADAGWRPVVLQAKDSPMRG